MPILPHSSLAVGLEALRANPLRTLLSTLGVIMGVGSMVSVLAMGDGVERYAREQIERTTDLLSVTITPVTMVTLDGQRVRRDDVIQFRGSDARAVADALPGVEGVALRTIGTAFVSVQAGAPPRGFALIGTLAREFAERERAFLVGGPFGDADTSVVVLNARAAGVVAGDSADPVAALGRTLILRTAPHLVVGVLAPSPDDRELRAVVPVDDAERALGPGRAPALTLTAATVEQVAPLKAAAEAWLASRYGANWRDRATVATSAARVEQSAQAFFIFKILMIAITGVSLLVGGIGIMNVLLASVAERTREIGIRKATGARDLDVLIQFLSESVAITGVGAALGVLLGLGIAFGTAAIMRLKTQAEVYAAITPGTVLFAAAASIVIGVAFGLYPALRAAKLSPIDAIRHE